MALSSTKIYRYLFALTLAILSLGTVFYHFVEKLTWFDSYYFSVITLSTVGYGDITPHTTIGKLFTTFYIFTGVGILTTFLSTAMKHRAEKVRKRRANRRKAKENQK